MSWWRKNGVQTLLIAGMVGVATYGMASGLAEQISKEEKRDVGQSKEVANGDDKGGNRQSGGDDFGDRESSSSSDGEKRDPGTDRRRDDGTRRESGGGVGSGPSSLGRKEAAGGERGGGKRVAPDRPGKTAAHRLPERSESTQELNEQKEQEDGLGGPAAPENGHVVAASVLDARIGLLPIAPTGNLLQVNLLTEEETAWDFLKGDDSK